MLLKELRVSQLVIDSRCFFLGNIYFQEMLYFLGYIEYVCQVCHSAEMIYDID